MNSYDSLWIQPYLPRKYDWGMMIGGVSRTFLNSVWIHRVYIYIYLMVHPTYPTG